MNLLRTTLSLLGVTIGIFAIIAVFTLVDSLERSIKSSLSFLDANNLDVGRFPYAFGPNVPWWEYLKRPYVNYSEYEFLKKNLKNSEAVTTFVSANGTIKYKSSSFNGVVVGVAHTHNDVYDMSKDVEFGRYFYYIGRNRGVEPFISMKGNEDDIGLVELEAEATGLLRSKRGLGSKDKDNFALNRQNAIMNIIGSTFDVIGVAGWAIGGFSILVGGFGIANIMFVSVRERTNIIGIQKSLGAKNFFILFQFLFEAIFLSLIGGGVGLFLVWLLSLASLGNLDLVLTFGNVVLGLGVAGIIGVVSSIVPALMAAGLDPVIAIRTTG